MPQPNASEVQARLRARYGNKAGSTRTGGGKNAMRRKKFRQKKSTNEFEKRLQANLKKLSCNTIPGIEEVNLFKSDGTVIHFVSPKVDAEVSSNTFIVSGQYTHNKIEELLPDILPQIGSDHLTQLKDYAEKFEALKPSNDDNDNVMAGGDADDVPMLIDEDLNFEQVAEEDDADDADADKDTDKNKEQQNDDDKDKEKEPATEPETATTTTTETVTDAKVEAPTTTTEETTETAPDSKVEAPTTTEETTATTSASATTTEAKVETTATTNDEPAKNDDDKPTEEVVESKKEETTTDDAKQEAAKVSDDTAAVTTEETTTTTTDDKPAATE